MFPLRLALSRKELFSLIRESDASLFDLPPHIFCWTPPHAFGGVFSVVTGGPKVTSQQHVNLITPFFP